MSRVAQTNGPQCGREIPVVTLPPEHLKWYGWQPWQLWSTVEWCGHRVEGIPVPTQDLVHRVNRSYRFSLRFEIAESPPLPGSVPPVFYAKQDGLDPSCWFAENGY